MSLTDLCEYTFQYGCGIRRSSALRSPRSKQLLQQPTELRLVGKRRVAEIMLLGEKLADRAFRNMPKPIRVIAPSWKQSSYSQQKQIAGQILEALTTEKWNRTNRRSNKKLPDLNSGLPAQYGSWTRGKYRPNCLGVSQMLIGFARQTGADHQLVTVVKQLDSANERLYYKLLVEISEVLKPFHHLPEVASEVSRLEKLQRKSLKKLAYHDRIQAHHALLIRSRKGWLVIDPYLGTSYLMSSRAAVSNGLKQVNAAPERVLLSVDSRIPLSDLYAGSLNALHTAFSRLRRREAANETADAAELLAMSELIGLLVGFGNDPINFDEDYEPQLKALRRWSVYRQYRDHAFTKGVVPSRQLKAYSESSPQERSAILDRYYRRAVADQDALKACIVRAATASIDCCMIWAYDAMKSKISRIHPVIELAHPTYMLGLATLNHVALHQQVDVPELSMYSSSQWILHDTLEAVERKGSARQKQTAVRRLRRLGRANRDDVLAGLIPYIEPKKEKMSWQDEAPR